MVGNQNNTNKYLYIDFIRKIIYIITFLFIFPIKILSAEIIKKRNQETIAFKGELSEKKESITEGDVSNSENQNFKKNFSEFISPLYDKFIIKKRFNKNPLSPFRGLLLKTSGDLKVRVSKEGKILSIDSIEGYDTLVIVQHEENFLSVYGNLGQTTVKEGDFLQQGELIGQLSSSKELFFQIYQGNKSIDPESVKIQKVTR